MFKPGDKIKCISPCIGITENKIYEVINIEVPPCYGPGEFVVPDEWVCIIDDDYETHFYLARRFKLQEVEPVQSNSDENTAQIITGLLQKHLDENFNSSAPYYTKELTDVLDALGYVLNSKTVVSVSKKH